MTPDEQQMLNDLANRIAQTPPPQRDPEAEQLIRTRIGSRPDALYLMTQTVLIQNLALEHAKQQIQELQQRAAAAPPAPASQPSFLGGGAPRGQGWPASQPGYGSAPPPPPPPGAPVSSGGGSSFLRSAATTAAGVAAGALAFEGIRALFGGAENLMGFGGPHVGGGFLGGGTPGSETIINNYYENPEQAASDDSGSYDNSDDSDTSDDSTDDSSDDTDYSDDSGDGSSDDGGSFDV